ncbi:UNVERIFIED_CONTAM: protein TAR1 [Sesamum calycinum]|uniref:Protein TAR1 n=1 Tax=Sesamum calycinum TaxID=2727403 RepID=A0AAW2L7W3_9LAMI
MASGAHDAHTHRPPHALTARSSAPPENSPEKPAGNPPKHGQHKPRPSHGDGRGLGAAGGPPGPCPPPAQTPPSTLLPIIGLKKKSLVTGVDIERAEERTFLTFRSVSTLPKNVATTATSAPRSAPTATPPGLVPRVLQRPPRPPTHRGLALAPMVGYAHSNPSQKIKVGWRCTPRGGSRLSAPLVRVLRRVEWGARWPAQGRAVTEARRRARAVRHDRDDGVPRAYRLPGLWPPPHSALVRAPSRSADRLSPFHIRPGPIAGPHPLSSRQFQALFTLFSKSFSFFPRGTCLASVSRPYLALDGIYRPIGATFPNNPTRRQRLVVRQGPGTTGLSPSPAPLSRGLGPGPPLRTLLQTTIRMAKPPDSQVGLFPVRLSLLGESFARVEVSTTTGRDGHRRGIAFGPATREGAREASVRPPHRAVEGATRCVTPRQTCPGLMASGATCVQRLDGSRDSAIHTKYRISLRSSSIREPRYPLPRVVLTFDTRPFRTGALRTGGTVRRTLRSVFLGTFRAGGFDNDPSAVSPTKTWLRFLLPLNDKVQWTSRDIAGSEPPTSPRSEHFTRPFNRPTIAMIYPHHDEISKITRHHFRPVSLSPSQPVVGGKLPLLGRAEFCPESVHCLHSISSKPAASQASLTSLFGAQHFPSSGNSDLEAFPSFNPLSHASAGHGSNTSDGKRMSYRRARGKKVEQPSRPSRLLSVYSAQTKG